MLSAAVEVRRIEIVLARYADEREERVAACVGQRGAHPMRRGGVGEAAHRPIGGDPFAGGVREDRGQIHSSGRRIDRSRLNRRDLLLAEGFADDVEAARERGVAEAAGSLPRPLAANDGNQRLLGVRKLALRFGQGGREGRNRFTGPVHGGTPIGGRRN